MANNNENKILNVPNLRFPEFTGEWKQSLLKEYLVENKERNTKGVFSKAEVLSVSGDKGIVNQIELLGRSYAGQSVLPYHIVRRNNIVYTKSPLSEFPYGIVKMNRGNDGIVSTLYAVYSVQETAYPSFIEYYFASKDRTNRYFKPIVRIGAKHDMKIGNGEVLANMVRFPSIKEQRRISEFLELIDKRIATQNKIIEDLKKLKSAIIDKTFCYPNESSPQKRFIGFTEEWHLVHLSDICQRVRTKNFNTQCTLVLTIAAQFGLVSQEEFFNKSVASDNLEGYYLLRKGDFAYNKSYSGDYAWGAVKRLEYFSEGVLSPLYICFRPDTARIDSDFLAHYFESKKWYKGIADIAGEGARNHGLLNLSVIDYFKTLHRIPSIQEQKVIANVLNKLTSKMSIEKNLYDDLLLQRQHLLQQMFI